MFLNRDVWIVLSIATAGPLACLPTLSSLKITSVVALLAALYLACILFAFSWFRPLEDELPCRQPDVSTESYLLLPPILDSKRGDLIL